MDPSGFRTQVNGVNRHLCRSIADWQANAAVVSFGLLGDDCIERGNIGAEVRKVGVFRNLSQGHPFFLIEKLGVGDVSLNDFALRTDVAGDDEAEILQLGKGNGGLIGLKHELIEVDGEVFGTDQL